jgi:hypothetical protein
MSPHHLLLLSELSGISAASKLFFVKLLQRFSEKTSFCFGVKLFASELAVTDRVVTNALKDLTACDYLIRTVSIKGPGRPTPTYRFGGAYEDALKTAIRDERLVQGALVDRVLKSRHSEKVEGLSTANRLLLAVLLGCSDRVGSVTDLDRGNLCRLTGLTPSSLQRQLKKLHTLKSIRAIAPGVMASDLFGPISSSIFLNLQNPTRCLVGESANFFIYTPIRDSTLYVTGFITKSLAYRMLEIGDKHSRGVLKKTYERTWSDAQGLLPDLARLEKMSELLKEKRVSRQQLSVILQARLEEYASFLLSHHWTDLACETYTADAILVDRIKRHLKGESDETSAKKAARIGVWQTSADLALLLHDTSVLLACWVQRMMNWVVGTPYELMRHVILPSSNDVGWLLKFVIVSYSDSPDTALGCYVLSDTREQKQIICKYKDEAAAI